MYTKFNMSQFVIEVILDIKSVKMAGANAALKRSISQLN
jgi:hypothetical protein